MPGGKYARGSGSASRGRNVHSVHSYDPKGIIASRQLELDKQSTRIMGCNQKAAAVTCWKDAYLHLVMKSRTSSHQLLGFLLNATKVRF